MSGKDRGMMKWAPYKSLIEQEDALSKAKKIKEKIDKPILTEDAENEINEILTNYKKEEVVVTYWKDGYLYNEKGIITNIDAIFHTLTINRKSIDLNSIYKIEII